MEMITQVNNSINGFVWGMFGLVLLIGTGILMTAVTGFFQVSRIGHWFKNTLGSMFTKKVIGHTKERERSLLSRRCVPHWLPQSVPVILPVLQPLSALVVPVRCSGCGSLPSLA